MSPKKTPEREDANTSTVAAPKSDVVMTRFNDAINDQDLEGLVALMTRNHKFVDTSNQSFSGRGTVIEAWRGFFSAFPAYRNHFERVVAMGDIAVAIGKSVCPEHPALDGPALWRAIVADGKVAEWRVYEDTPQNRERLEVTD